jgi:hypothetical protein
MNRPAPYCWYIAFLALAASLTVQTAFAQNPDDNERARRAAKDRAAQAAKQMEAARSANQGEGAHEFAPHDAQWVVWSRDTTTGKMEAAYFETQKAAYNYIDSYLKVKNLSTGKLMWEFVKLQQIAPKWTADLVDLIGEAKDALDKAREFAEKGVAALVRERRVGDTIEEYLKVMRTSLDNVERLRQRLMSMTGTIETRFVEKVNHLIDDYDNQANEFFRIANSGEVTTARGRENGGGIVSSYAPLRELEKVRPGDLRGQLDNSPPVAKSQMLQSKGKGKVGDAELTVEFGQHGSVSISGETKAKGKWAGTGTAVFMETESHVWQGTVKGDTIAGMRYSKSGGDGPVEWQVGFSGKREAATSDEDVSQSLVGTVWLDSNGPKYDDIWRLRFLKPENEFVYTHKHERLPSGGSGKYKAVKSGDDILVTFTEKFTYEYRIKGNQMFNKDGKLMYVKE